MLKLGILPAFLLLAFGLGLLITGLALLCPAVALVVAGIVVTGGTLLVVDV